MEIRTKVTGIQHVGIPTNDMQKSISFYEGIGFEIVWQTVNEQNNEAVAFLQLGNLVMEIYENKQAVMKTGAIDHIALDVTDIDFLFESVQKNGYKMLDEKVQYLPFWEHGVKFFTIEGPNGEKIEFCEKMSDNDLRNNNPTPDFLPGLVGSFAKPAAENPTVAIMEAAFRHHGLHYRYINCEVGPENLEAAVNGAKAMGWRGFNCSIPNKIKVIQYLDELGDSAKIIGAVNTVIIGEDKRTRGENTDGKGFVKAISEVTSIPGKKVVLFGAGGAARAISVEMALAGAASVIILNIDRSGQELADLLNSQTPTQATFTLWDHPFEIPADADIVINATSVGLYPNVDQRLNIDTNTLLPHMVVADCIPNPAYTHFVKDATARGCRHVLPGMNMLVNQAVIAVKYWTGVDVEAEIMRAELKKVLGL